MYKIYDYHPNHLGSTEFLTNFEGETIQKCVYMPYGETFIKQGGAPQPHLFNGKERDAESGLYYYGARYYDERTALFANPDPLWTGYAWTTPYAFCVGNPARYVDFDGREPWEDENVRDAREYAGENGGRVLKWRNAEGYNSAAVLNVSVQAVEGGYGVTVEAKRFKGTKFNNYNVVLNLLGSFERAVGCHEGTADGANTGFVTPRDKAVGSAVMGIMTGVVSFGLAIYGSAATSAVVSCLGVFNSVDDATTDLYGETFAMRRFDTEAGKGYVQKVKVGIGVANIRYDFKSVKYGATTAERIIGVADGANTTSSVIKSGFDVINDKR